MKAETQSRAGYGPKVISRYFQAECRYRYIFVVDAIMVRFHRRLRVGSVRKGSAQVAFPPRKVDVIRTEPYYSSVGVLAPERLPASSS